MQQQAAMHSSGFIVFVQVAQAAAHIFHDIQQRTQDITLRLDRTQKRVKKSFDESNNV